MILSKKEKEETVIKLLNDGLKFKDIAKQLHISLSDISKIKRKITGEETEKPLSMPSKAFQLFLEKKVWWRLQLSLIFQKMKFSKFIPIF
jgi:transposase